MTAKIGVHYAAKKSLKFELKFLSFVWLVDLYTHLISLVLSFFKWLQEVIAEFIVI